MDEDTTSIDTSTADSSSAIENFDFSKPDGGLTEAYEQESEESTDAAQDEAEQPDNAEEQAAEEDASASTEDNGEQDIAKMSESERNNFFAQRRIAEKEAGQKLDNALLGQLRDQAKTEYVDVEPEEEALDDLDPNVAKMLREQRQKDRERDVERAIERIGNTRENIRLSILQAESGVPMFNPASDSYNPQLHEMALSNWAHRYGVVAPGPGGEPQMVGVKDGSPSPYEYLQEQARAFEGIVKAERLKGQQIARRNSARADTGSSVGANTRNANSAQALEERIGDIPLASF